MATTFKAVANNAVGTLAADITSGAGAMSLSAGQGSAFPSSGSFWVTLFTNSVDDGFEIVLVYTRSGDTFTSLARGQQGTLASAWTAGTKVQLLWTKGSVEDIHTAINGIENGTTILLGAWVRNTISQYSLIQQTCRNTVGSPQGVESGDTLFTLIVTGYDGSTYRDAAKLLAKVGTTPGASDMPGAWEFHTSPDGSSTPQLAVRIDHNKMLDVKGILTAGSSSIALTDSVGYIQTAALKTGTTNNGKLLAAGATEGSAAWNDLSALEFSVLKTSADLTYFFPLLNTMEWNGSNFVVPAFTGSPIKVKANSRLNALYSMCPFAVTGWTLKEVTCTWTNDGSTSWDIDISVYKQAANGSPVQIGTFSYSGGFPPTSATINCSSYVFSNELVFVTFVGKTSAVALNLTSVQFVFSKRKI